MGEVKAADRKIEAYHPKMSAPWSAASQRNTTRQNKTPFQII